MIGLTEKTIEAFIEAAYNEKCDKTFHFTRLAMYRELKDVFRSMDDEKKTCLAVSHSIDFGRILGLAATKMIEANYPEHNIINLGFGDGEFDFCISDQVLEHVEGNPYKAFSESARVIRSGGLFVTRLALSMRYMEYLKIFGAIPQTLYR